MQGNVEIITKNSAKTDSSYEDIYNSGVFGKVIDPNELSDCVSEKPLELLEGNKYKF
ncbi:hypothetical protein WMZ97_06120 [Lentibacillus sp. N15]